MLSAEAVDPEGGEKTSPRRGASSVEMRQGFPLLLSNGVNLRNRKVSSIPPSHCHKKRAHSAHRDGVSALPERSELLASAFFVQREETRTRESVAIEILEISSSDKELVIELEGGVAVERVLLHLPSLLSARVEAEFSLLKEQELLACVAPLLSLSALLNPSFLFCSLSLSVNLILLRLHCLLIRNLGFS